MAPILKVQPKKEPAGCDRKIDLDEAWLHEPVPELPIDLAPETGFTCPKCTFRTRHPSSWYRHKKHCGTKYVYTCHLCSTEVSRKDLLKRHYRTVHQTNPNRADSSSVESVVTDASDEGSNESYPGYSPALVKPELLQPPDIALSAEEELRQAIASIPARETDGRPVEESQPSTTQNDAEAIDLLAWINQQDLNKLATVNVDDGFDLLASTPEKQVPVTRTDVVPPLPWTCQWTGENTATQPALCHTAGLGGCDLQPSLNVAVPDTPIDTDLSLQDSKPITVRPQPSPAKLPSEPLNEAFTPDMGELNLNDSNPITQLGVPARLHPVELDRRDLLVRAAEIPDLQPLITGFKPQPDSGMESDCGSANPTPTSDLSKSPPAVGPATEATRRKMFQTCPKLQQLPKVTQEALLCLFALPPTECPRRWYAPPRRTDQLELLLVWDLP
jgi:hypothetical protein